MAYYIAKNTSYSFEEALQKVSEELQKEGFGILTEIDMRDKFKEKVGVEFRKYTILGACNPSLAYNALQEEDKIGTMLPCNVIVQQLSETNVEIAAIDPVASMQAVKNEAVSVMADEIHTKLERVINAL